MILLFWTKLVREGGAAGDPPPKIYGVAVVRREDAPPVLLPLNLVPWPLSGRATPRSIHPPTFAARRSSGERVYLRHSPRRPSSRGLRQGERRQRSYPPIFAARRSSRGSIRLQCLSRRTCPVAFVGERCAGDPPLNVQGGCRPGGGCVSGPPPLSR